MKNQPHRFPFRTPTASRLRWMLATLWFFCMAFSHTAVAEELSLAAALKMAQDHNRDLRLSSLGLESAKAATVIAHAAPNPTLSVQTASYNPRTGIGPGGLRDKMLDTTIRIDQLIERGGKRELRTENAHHLELAAHSDLKDAARQVRLTVSQAYFDLLAAQEKRKIADETANLFDDTLQAAEKRKKAGDLAGADVERIRVDALLARVDARQAEADLENARIALAVLLGMRDHSVGLHASDRWPEITPTTSAEAVVKLAERRPDVQAAMERVNAAEAGLKLARASRVRDISVGAQFEHFPGNDPSSPSSSNNTYGIGVQIPLFVRYDNRGEIRAAEVALESAQETLEKTRDAACADIRQALQDLQAATERAASFHDNVLPAAEKSASAAEYGFRSGASGAMDLLDARRTYRATQLAALNAQADYAKALAAWHAAVQEDDTP